MNQSAEQARLRLDSLIEISQMLMSAVEPDEVLRVILNAAVRLFAAEASSIALLDPDDQKLAFAFSAGEASVGEFRIDLGQGIAGWVAQTGTGTICNDVSQDARFFDGVDRTTGFQTRSLLCAPLKQRDRVIGTIEALNTARPGGFSPEDLELLTAFGGLAGAAIERVQALAATRNANTAFSEAAQDRYRFVFGNSPVLAEPLRLARSVAPTNTTVLLLGESGTGKEVMARALHQWSARAGQPFVAVNCVALTPDLIESELFGHEKGAFTGAIVQKKGKFELAHGGTLFLDEVGDLPLTLQTKLLRVLQEKEFQRVGGSRDIRANVRILAATNRDLRRAIQTGGFREDLYYRLNVVSITLPPLRERRDEIPALVEHFIERHCREVKRARMRIEPAALELLKGYGWPGNVRELQNVLERAVVLGPPGAEITRDDFPAEIRLGGMPDPDPAVAPAAVAEAMPIAEATDRFKRAMIRKVLDRAGGNQAEAARMLGLQRSNLSRLMKSLGLR